MARVVRGGCTNEGKILAAPLPDLVRLLIIFFLSPSSLCLVGRKMRIREGGREGRGKALCCASGVDLTVIPPDLGFVPANCYSARFFFCYLGFPLGDCGEGRVESLQIPGP